MSRTDWVKWDYVAPRRDGVPEAHRLPVPGGWLYLIGDKPPTFVADPEAPHVVEGDCASDEEDSR
jgi:hypothetical protein